MMGARGLSRRGAKLIAGFEGFVACPYRDSVGVLTIGCGHTRGVTEHTPCITRQHAQRLLRDDAAPVAQAALRSTHRRLNRNELDALTSFGFNLGPGYFERGHTMGDALRKGDRLAIANAFLPYDQAGGHALAGLTRRRHAERHLFLHGYRK